MCQELSFYSNNVLASFTPESIVVDNARRPELSSTDLHYQDEAMPPLIPYVKCMHGRSSIKKRHNSTVQKERKCSKSSVPIVTTVTEQGHEQYKNHNINERVHYSKDTCKDCTTTVSLQMFMNLSLSVPYEQQQQPNDDDCCLAYNNQYKKLMISSSSSISSNKINKWNTVDVAPKMPCRRSSVETSLCCIK
jgi:hypothetical protein